MYLCVNNQTPGYLRSMFNNNLCFLGIRFAIDSHFLVLSVSANVGFIGDAINDVIE